MFQCCSEILHRLNLFYHQFNKACEKRVAQETKPDITIFFNNKPKTVVKDTAGGNMLFSRLVLVYKKRHAW